MGPALSASTKPANSYSQPSSYGPTLSLSGATYDTSAPIFGKRSLSGGSGQVTVNLPNNGRADQAAVTLTVQVRCPPGAFAGSSGNFIQLSSNGRQVGWSVGSDGTAVADFNGANATGVNLLDGVPHQLEVIVDCNYSNAYTAYFVDANSVAGPSGQPYLKTGAAVLKIDMAQLPPGSVLDAVWLRNGTTQFHAMLCASPFPDPYTVALYNFEA